MPVPKPSMWEDLTVADVVSNVFVETATLGIVFFLGAMVGSFVNVVLYRMPRRMNLLWPPSRCPSCANRLKLVDNVPVVGWLRLRGKCRHCGAAIPRSYLRIEVGFGLLFLALMYLEVHTGSWNLPLKTRAHHIGALWTIWYPNPEILRIYGYHALLAAFLATLFLFVRRGERLPGLLVLAGLLLASLLPIWSPTLQQVPWGSVSEGAPRGVPTTGFVDSLVGLSVGIALGTALGITWPKPPAHRSAFGSRLAIPTRWDFAVVLSLAGAWLGWQALVSVALVTALVGVFRPKAQPVTLAVGSVAMQVVCWRLLTEHLPWWPGPHTGLPLMAGWVVLVVVLIPTRRALVARVEPKAPTAVTAISEESPSTDQSQKAPATRAGDSVADSENGTLA